jgi:hypothetical protein
MGFNPTKLHRYYRSRKPYVQTLRKSVKLIKNQINFSYKNIKKLNKSKVMIPFKHCADNMWIVKPVNLNQVNIYLKTKS